MFDTHCHLNFKSLLSNVGEVIQRAKEAGVNHIVVPGTDVDTSRKSVEIAAQHENIYAAVGIHPHHVFQVQISRPRVDRPLDENLKSEIQKIEVLLKNPKVVAIGEVGLDRHYYQNTRHENYQVTDDFIELQKQFFLEQLRLANIYKKTLIIHNREAKKDLLDMLTNNYYLLATKMVFHCCEPDEELLRFAKEHNMYIGVDGDITYRKDKQEFIKKVPLEMLVLETDSPFLHPEPLRSQPRNIRGPNEPMNLKLIAEFIAKVTNSSLDQLIETTTTNAKSLFGIV